MKKCRSCGNENSDEMNFCLECGAALPNTLVNSAAGGAPQNQSGIDTLSFGSRSAPTVIAANQPNFTPAAATVTPAPPPRSKKKIFLIGGGILSALALVFLGGALLIYYSLQAQQEDADADRVPTTPTRTPRAVAADKSPKPSPSVSPSVSSASSPDENSSASPPPPPASPSASPDDSSSSSPSSPAPETSFTPPIEATKSTTFAVSADEGWQTSDADVVPLESFQTTASGSVDVANVKNGISPAGVADDKSKSRRIYPEYPTGALLMRTRFADGKFSRIQPVTAPPSIGLWENEPDERGRLEFCVNDNAPQNNSGQFSVTVTMLDAPKQKKRKGKN